MELIPAKTILSPYREGGEWFGGNYNCNLYRGCCHGCIYCDSRSECYHVEEFDTVKAKQDAIPKLRRELKSKTRGGVVFSGAMSDPYNPFEKELCLTRGSLEVIRDYGFGAAVTTKSDLVTRDADLLLEIEKHAPVLVLITITTADDGLSRKIEPGAPVSSRRFAAVRELVQRGICAGVLMTPVLPFLEDAGENLRRMASLVEQSGAKFWYAGFGVTLRSNQRDYYYEKLDEKFPGLSGRYRSRYGDRYYCAVPGAKERKSQHAAYCKKLKIPSGMKDIIKAYKSGYEQEQLSLF